VKQSFKKNEYSVSIMAEEPKKRDLDRTIKYMKILTAISLGKKRNKELARALDTDKSFTSKQVRDLEKEGLVRREGEGKEVRYEINQFNVMKFLQTKVIITTKKEVSENEGEEEKE